MCVNKWVVYRFIPNGIFTSVKSEQINKKMVATEPKLGLIALYVRDLETMRKEIWDGGPIAFEELIDRYMYLLLTG